MFTKHADSTTGGGGAIARSIQAPRFGVAGAEGITRASGGITKLSDATMRVVNDEKFNQYYFNANARSDDSTDGMERISTSHAFGIDTKGLQANGEKISKLASQMKSLESQIKQDPSRNWKSELDNVSNQLRNSLDTASKTIGTRLQFEKDFYQKGRGTTAKETFGVKEQLRDAIKTSTGSERQGLVSAKREIEKYLTKNETVINKQVSAVEGLVRKFNDIAKPTGYVAIKVAKTSFEDTDTARYSPESARRLDQKRDFTGNPFSYKQMIWNR